MNTIFDCLFCREIYSTTDLSELRGMGEKYYKDKSCFICPDCWDNFLRKDPSDQIKILMELGDGKATPDTGAITESTWIYVSEEFAPPGAPVGLPKGDFTCDVSVRPGNIAFVMTASYSKPKNEPAGIWFYEHKPFEELPYIVYAWRKDRRVAAPLSDAYIDSHGLRLDQADIEYEPKNNPADCFRAPTKLEQELSDIPSDRRMERIRSYKKEAER